MRKIQVERDSWIYENIAKEHFHICGATGVAEYAMIARDVMIAYATKAHVHIQHLSKEESVKVVEFAQGLRCAGHSRSSATAFL